MKKINQVIRETGVLSDGEENQEYLTFLYNGVFYEIQLPLKQSKNYFVTAYGDNLFDCFEVELTKDTITFFSLEGFFCA